MNVALRRILPNIVKNVRITRSAINYSILSQQNRNVSNESIKNNENEELAKGIIDSVNKLIESKQNNQTFAVIHFYEQQYLVHLGDIICVNVPIPAEVGEKIKIEKCLLFGNSEYSLIGRPLLNRDLIQIEATIIEKTMSQTFFNMKHVPRDHGNRTYRFIRNPQTMLRINEIKICHSLNQAQKQIN